jgi:hypothetical protein
VHPAILIFSTLDAMRWPHAGPITGSLDEQTPEWVDAVRYIFAARAEQQAAEQQKREREMATKRNRSTGRGVARRRHR